MRPKAQKNIEYLQNVAIPQKLGSRSQLYC